MAESRRNPGLNQKLTAEVRRQMCTSAVFFMRINHPLPSEGMIRRAVLLTHAGKIGIPAGIKKGIRFQIPLSIVFVTALFVMRRRPWFL